MSCYLMILLLVCLVLRDPHPASRDYLNLLAALFLSTLICYNDWYERYPKLTPQNRLKSKISVKIPSSNALAIKTWEKTPSKRGQTSKIDDAYTLSAVFKEAQGSQKGVKMEARMESLGTQSHKNPPHTELQQNHQTIRL